MTKKRIIPKEILEELYIVQSLTQAEMAKRLHASIHTIRRNLIEQGIPLKSPQELHGTHGMSDTRQYHIWQALKTRCSNSNHPEFQKYGAQGISYPEKWEVFEGFWSDMIKGYTDDKTIDRIDGTKSFSKENCRWVTYKGQNRNKADNVLLTYKSETKCIAAWAEEVPICQSTLYNRKCAGWSDEKILTTLIHGS